MSMMNSNAVATGIQAPRMLAQMQDRIMGRLDKDGSGDLSGDEISRSLRLSRNIETADADQNGTLTSEEVGDYLALRMQDGPGSLYGEHWGSEMRMQGMGAMMRMEAQAADDMAVAQFDAMDTDGDGVLSDAELQAEIAAQEAAEAAAEARAAKIAEIARMDQDGDGMLSVAELQAELTTRAEDRAVATFDRIDSDGDGILSDGELAADITAQQAAAEAQAAMTAEAEAIEAAAIEAAETIPAAAPAGTPTPAPTGEGPAAEPRVMSLIENVFDQMLENRGTTGDVPAMSAALYAEAQDILIEQMEAAAEFAASAYADDAEAETAEV